MQLKNKPTMRLGKFNKNKKQAGTLKTKAGGKIRKNKHKMSKNTSKLRFAVNWISKSAIKFEKSILQNRNLRKTSPKNEQLSNKTSNPPVFKKICSTPKTPQKTHQNSWEIPRLATLSLMSAPCQKRKVARLGKGLLQRFTSSHVSRCFATCDSWTQTSVKDYFFRSLTEFPLKWPTRIKSIRSYCLFQSWKLPENEEMTDAFNLFQTNDRNASTKRKTQLTGNAARQWLVIAVMHIFILCEKHCCSANKACFLWLLP